MGWDAAQRGRLATKSLGRALLASRACGFMVEGSGGGMSVVEDLDDASRPRSLGCLGVGHFSKGYRGADLGPIYLGDVQGPPKMPDWLPRLPLHQTQCLGRLANEHPNMEHNRDILGGHVIVKSVVLHSHLN